MSLDQMEHLLLPKFEELYKDGCITNDESAEIDEGIEE